MTPPLEAAQKLVSDYLGLWLMHEPAMRALAERVNQMNVVSHVQAHQQEPRAAIDAERKPYRVNGGVALIPITGLMMKRPSSLDDATGTKRVRNQVRLAADDPDVDAILMVIDSPGGTVAGTQDLADEVTRARQSKPVTAYIEDMGASAAYWVASQADRVYANATAQIGSIGVMAVAIDSSELAANAGVKVHVLRTGEFKGGGVEGAPISEEQLAEWQRTVDGLGRQFVEAVARGRPTVSRAALEGYADGRTWLADEAAAMGLIDDVRPFDAVLADLRMDTLTRRQTAMSDKQPTHAPATQPATFDELTAVCGGEDEAFICKAQKNRWTLEQARQEWVNTLAERAAAAEARAEAAEAKAAETAQAARVVGVEPVETTESASGDDPQVTQFDRLVREHMAAAGCSRMEAVEIIAMRYPAVHKAFLEATNDAVGNQALASKARALAAKD